MVVCSPRFQHLDIHKATWLFPDRNQIDHNVVDGRHVSNVLHLRTYRPNMDSDHKIIKKIMKIIKIIKVMKIIKFVKFIKIIKIIDIKKITKIIKIIKNYKN